MSKEILEKESAQGKEYKLIFDQYVAPFFETKSQDLFEAFMGTSSDDVSALQQIKMQHNVLEGMRQHFEHYILTGKMADKSLSELENSDEEQR